MSSLAVGWTAAPSLFLTATDGIVAAAAPESWRTRSAEICSGAELETRLRTLRKEQDGLPDTTGQDQLNFYLDVTEDPFSPTSFDHAVPLSATGPALILLPAVV